MVQASNGTRTYINNDGLKLRMGVDQARLNREGSPAQAGPLKVMEYDIVATELGAVSVVQVHNLVSTVVMPATMILKSALLTVTEAFTSAGAPTLDLGTCTQGSTIIDDDGIAVAIALASLATIGNEVDCAGALVDTSLAQDMYLTERVNVAAYTAGRAKLIVTLMPIGDDMA